MSATTTLAAHDESTRATSRLLLRLAWRRDRIMIGVWYGILLLVLLASAASTATVYASPADRVQAAQAINASPGLVALYGPILDVHSEGELAMTKMTVVYAVLVALMLLFVVRRHTRLDEENGQAELLGGTAITSRGPLAAALTFGAGVALLLGLLAAVVNAASGLPAAGSVAFGACWAGTGLVATGLTALACQISPSARTCAAIAASAIPALFVLRAVGDTTDASWLSWLSPFGWNTQLRAFSGTRWWVLLLYVAAAAALAGVAWAVRGGRDLGSGLVEPRPGPATGSPRLADAIALSLRVHAPMLVGWTVGIAVLGLVFGAISPSFDAFDSPNIEKLLQRLGGAGAFRDTLLGAVVSVVALIVTCFAIAVVNHGGADEQDGRTEQVLATATSRSRAFLATAVVAIGGVTWLLAVAGLTLAIGVGSSSDHSFGRLVASPIAQAPAVWTVTALCLLCYALRSRWAVLGWGLVVLFATLGQIGELLQLPDWTLQLSPYTHSPVMPLQPFELGPALALSGIAAAVLVAAWLRFRDRDIG
jgi:ABC-2 type transport system permease protein